jgi:hypothetical protein
VRVSGSRLRARERFRHSLWRSTGKQRVEAREIGWFHEVHVKAGFFSASTILQLTITSQRVRCGNVVYAARMYS